MTKSQLVTLLAQLLKLTRKDADAAVDAVFDSIAGSLEAGRRVELRGFCSFGLKERRERAGRNPKTGESARVEGQEGGVFQNGQGVAGEGGSKSKSVKQISVYNSSC